VSFKNWLVEQKKSQRTASSYAAALRGTISNWAMEAGLTDVPLSEISNVSKLEQVRHSLGTVATFVDHNKRGNNMYSAALNAYLKYVLQSEDPESADDIERDLAELLATPQDEVTERQELVRARVGQGRFRKGVVQQWQRCAVTGYDAPDLLVASHIKPWRVSTNEERLDAFNGLLLVPTIDKVFDRGYVSFSEDGELCISASLRQPSVLGILAGVRVQLRERHQRYMEFHREFVFRAA
jgi:hypothetical protein